MILIEQRLSTKDGKGAHVPGSLPINVGAGSNVALWIWRFDISLTPGFSYVAWLMAVARLPWRTCVVGEYGAAWHDAGVWRTSRMSSMISLLRVSI
jgi:hypothetical protein